MATVLRRLILLLSLMMWQGGFMFYGGVVVPVGAAVLGSHLQQGFVTQRVTNYLNGIGAVALVAWAWDLAVGRSPVRRRLRWGAWGLLALLMVVLAQIHLRLDGLLDADDFHVLNQSAYRIFHRWYLSISTGQWVVSIFLLGWTLWAWQIEGGHGDTIPGAAHKPGRRASAEARD